MQNVRGVTLADGEVVIREYEASKLEQMNAEGYVIATNRRLIFTGSTNTTFGSSVLVRDTKIDSITGVSGGLSQKKSMAQLIIGVIIAIFGLVLLSNDMPTFLWLIVLALGAFIAYRGLKSKGVQMYVSIMSSQASPAINVSVEASKGFFSRIKSHDAFLTVYASGPGAHTEPLINEIGALIQDIQTMGDLAIDKWRNVPMATAYVAPQPTYVQPTQPVAPQPTYVQPSQPVAPQQPTVQPTQAASHSNAAQNKCECGTLLEPNAVFCNECGKKVEENIFA